MDVSKFSVPVKKHPSGVMGCVRQRFDRRKEKLDGNENQESNSWEK
jgi:hypothetical protein